MTKTICIRNNELHKQLVAKKREWKAKTMEEVIAILLSHEISAAITDPSSETVGTLAK